MTRDRLLHIHQNALDPCLACGDTPTSNNDFVTDPGYWNQQKRNCAPTKIISPSYIVTGRADPRTSALKSERKAPLKKVRDSR